MSTNRVLLINTNLIKPPIAPIGLDYIGSYLEKNGFSIDLLDLNFSADISRMLQDNLNRDSYLAIGLNIRNTDDCYYLSQFDFLPQIKDILAQIKKHSDSPVIIGGGGFSLMPGEILEEFKADHGIIGDGEAAFLDLLCNIKNNEETGRVISSTYDVLEGFPCSSRDIVDNVRYFREGGMGNIETRRGCNRRCIYCADPIIKGCSLRTRPVKTVIHEIKNLLKKGIDVIHFCDSEFNIPQIYAKEVLNAMIEQGIGDRIRWYAYMSPEYIDEEFAAMLKKSGCEGIDFGIDSTSAEILKNLGRSHDIEDIINTSRLCRKYSIKFMFDLLLGGPGENRNTIKETIETVKKLDPYCAGISYGIRVYPGTKISEISRKAANVSVKTGIDGNRFLFGRVMDNESFIKPVFYISPDIGTSIVGYANELVGRDERFFIGATENVEKNYNYNKNTKLQDAIKKGYRGAYWDILRQTD